MKISKVLLIMVLLIASLILDAENSKEGDGMSTTKSGLQYIITKQGNGAKAQNGDRVTVHYIGKLTNGNVFDSSIDRGDPFSFNLGEGEVIKGWDEGISLLQVGDKATFRIPPELGYGTRNLESIPANSTLIFEVELLATVPAPEIESFDIENKKIQTTKSGLQYINVFQGNGEKAEKGEKVSVHYTGYLEDGSMFDSSVKRGQPFEFQLGAGRVIKGWDEGIALMKEGDKFRFIIPFELGYGERGYPPIIPQKATLIFDVELLKVK